MHKELENLQEFEINLMPGGDDNNESGEQGGTDVGGGTQK